MPSQTSFTPVRLALLLLPASLLLGSPADVAAGPFWNWGHPGYADNNYYSSYNSFYAPSGGYAAYGPAYYGPSAGCCGSGCGSCGSGCSSCGTGGCSSCQSNYAGGCGCDSCGCSSCGNCGYGCADGSCAGGCANGNCASGNCNLNTAPDATNPIPDPNLPAEPVRPRTPSEAPRPSSPPPPRRTFEDTDAPRYEPPTRAPNPMGTNPMTSEPMGTDSDPFNSARPPEAPPSRSPAPAPSRTPAPAGTDRSLPPMDTPPGEDGFRSRPLPSRTPATEDPFGAPIDPANPGTGGFSAGRVELPNAEEPTTPAETPSVLPETAPAPEASQPVEAEREPLDGQPAQLKSPVSGPPLDLITTTSPVIARSRMAIRGSFGSPALARTPKKKADREWSAAPADARIVRQ